MLAAALAGVAIAMNAGKVPLALPLLRAELGLSADVSLAALAVHGTGAEAGGVLSGTDVPG